MWLNIINFYSSEHKSKENVSDVDIVKSDSKKPRPFFVKALLFSLIVIVVGLLLYVLSKYLIMVIPESVLQPIIDTFASRPATL